MAAENKLILQGFEWHTPSNPPASNETHSSSSHYARLKRLLPFVADLGVTSLWLPPGCKGMHAQGNGYDVYDLWDLGEFDQKGARSTKWGSREELDDLLATGRECGVEMIWDAVLNHKAGGDQTEECWAVEADEEDRRYEICPPKKIEAWLRFDFNGRQQNGQLKYSSLRWRAEHFNGVDWDHRGQSNKIYKLIDDPSNTSERFVPPEKPRPSMSTQRRSSRTYLSRILPRFRASAISTQSQVPPPQRPGKGWAQDVDKENGNFDFLMFSNVDYTHSEVREDIMHWGRWMVEDIGLEGFRLDAVKHFSFHVTRDWIQQVHEASIAMRKKDAFIVGEVWSGELKPITNWLDAVQTKNGPQIYAYDSPLLYNFSRISEDAVKQKADLRNILRDSLLEARPEAAVTLVGNHDTQAGERMYTAMDRCLKPLFYAFTLLRKGGLSCVFWGDLYGTKGPHAEEPIPRLADLMLARKLFAYGEQVDYPSPAKDVLAWTRAGMPDRLGSGCAVVTCAGNNPKRYYSVEMDVGCKEGDVWVDVLDRVRGKEVVIGENGKGRFLGFAKQACVWVRKEAVEGRGRFPVQLDAEAAK